MKKLFSYFLLIFLFLSQAVWASDEPTVKLLNHTQKELNFEVTQGSEIVPDFSKKFVLAKNASIVSSIKEGSEPDTTEAYLRVTQVRKEAFFGVETGGIHGYLALGLAYSWRTLDEQTTVTFCLPQEYDEQKGCP